MPARRAAQYLYTHPTCGPFLRLGTCAFDDPFPPKWSASVLFICKPFITAPQPPALAYIDVDGEHSIPGRIIDSFADYNFWRFDIALPLSPAQRRIKYWVSLSPACGVPPAWEFFLPGSHQTWRWAAYSCSGFSLRADPEEWGGNDQPLWGDLLRRHRASPIHALVGGGDQLYNDEVFRTPLVREWAALRSRGARQGASFTEYMREQVEAFYFGHYCRHFMGGGMREALATIPSVMLWDDHDIFDGWGSYPDDLLRCPVLEGIYQAACKFYLLFQQHVTADMVERGESDLFGGPQPSAGCPHRAHCFVKMLGADVALVGADTRAERSMKQVMREETWDAVCGRIRNLPASVRHVVVLFTVPVVFPKVPVAEAALECLGKMNRLPLSRTSLFDCIMASNDPGPLDDLAGQWTSRRHSKERARCVESLQAIAAERGVRVTFLSGDVRCAAVGRFYTHPKVEDLTRDPHFMPQIVTSAIVDRPPPAPMLRLWQFFSAARAGGVNRATREKMVRAFRSEHPSSDKLLGRRNWLEVEASQGGAGGLAFHLRVEEDHRYMRDPPRVYTVSVPALDRQGWAPETPAVNIQGVPGDRQGLGSDRQGVPLDGQRLGVDRQGVPLERQRLGVDRQGLVPEDPASPAASGSAGTPGTRGPPMSISFGSGGSVVATSASDVEAGDVSANSLVAGFGGSPLAPLAAPSPKKMPEPAPGGPTTSMRLGGASTRLGGEGFQGLALVMKGRRGRGRERRRRERGGGRQRQRSYLLDFLDGFDELDALDGLDWLDGGGGVGRGAVAAGEGPGL